MSDNEREPEVTQLVESRRENGKVRQRVIVHLGPYPSVEEVMAGYSERADRARGYERNWRAWAEAERITIERIRERVRPDLVGTDIPRPEGRTRNRYWYWRDLAEQQGRWAARMESLANKVRQRSA